MSRPSRRRRIVRLVPLATLLLALCAAVLGGAFGPQTAYAADDIEVSIARFEDCTMMPDWDNYISDEDQYFEYNHTTGEGHPGTYTVSSVKVVSEKPENAGDTVVEIERVYDGWLVHAKNYGEATIEVTYRRDNASSDETYTANILVADNTYTVNMWFEGSETTLPGGTVSFAASGRRSYMTEDGHYEEAEDGFTYRWRLDEGTSKYATLQVNPDDPARASVTFDSSFGDEDVAGTVVIVELLDEDGDVVASDDRWATAESDYCELYPYGIAQVQIDEEFSITPQVRHYVKGADGYEDLTAECTFEVSFNNSNVQLLDDSNGVYRFKRIGVEPIDIKITAYDDDKNLVSERDYWVPSPQYDAWFEEDPVEFFVKTDDSGNRSGSATVKLNVGDDLARLTGYVVEWTLGEMDESGFTQIFEQFRNSELTCNVDGAKLLDAGARGGVVVEARILNKDGQTQITETSCWVEIREEEYHYDFENDFPTIPGRVYDVPAARLAFVVDEQHPEGEDLPFTITDVKIKSQTPEKGVKTVVELKKQTSGKGWEYTAVGHGKATIEYSYNDVYGVAKKHEFTVTVTNELFRVFITSADGRLRALPGDSIDVVAEGQHIIEGVDGSSSVGMTYEWELGEASKQFATIKVDEKDSSRATVTFKQPPEGKIDIWEEVEVLVKMSYDGEERAENNEFLLVASMFDDIYPTLIDINFPPNTTITVTPEVRRYSIEDEGGYTVLPNVSFTWNYDMNVLEITDNKDGSYTLKRLSGEHGCDYTLIANWTDEWGHQRRHVAWYWFLAEAVMNNTQEMHRLYNPNSGEHFYTAAVKERDALIKLGWIYEGVGWIAPVTSDTPVYRLYNKYAGDHHYTTAEKERDALVKVGWIYEGIGWYSAPKEGGVPLYRQYNPNAKAGSHNYTTSKQENDALVNKYGWHAEGIGWYGVKQ